MFGGNAEAQARPYHVVVCETPSGSGGGQPVERYRIEGTGGDITRLSDIEGTLVDDPVAVIFRTPVQLLVSNRSAHSGNSTISTFIFDPDYLTYTPGPVISGNGLTDAVQMALDPVTGELFVTNWTGGVVSRFLFDESGNAVPNGTLTLNDSDAQLGIAIREANQDLFISDYNYIRHFRHQPDGSYVRAADINIPGETLIHFMCFRGDELYVCGFSTGMVYRFLFDDNGDPLPNGTVVSPDALGVAFSPDGQEMLVSHHLNGAIARYLYDEATDTWQYFEEIETPSLAGIATMLMCIGDLDQDLDVDQSDLGILLSAYGNNADGDLDGDGVTGQSDLGLLLASYGSDCE